jgi:hypothetical protein
MLSRKLVMLGRKLAMLGRKLVMLGRNLTIIKLRNILHRISEAFELF